MRPEAQAIVDQCKDFVKAMARVEASLGGMGQTLAKEERTAVVQDVLAWLNTDEVKAPFTREVARELIAQLSVAGTYSDYKGTTDYIQ